MGIVSGGSGGGGPAAGSYLPVANKTGVTVDTTTYADPIAGGGAKLTTLVFAADQGALGIALSGDAFPRWLLASDARDGLYFGSGAFDPYVSGPLIQTTTNGQLTLQARTGQPVGLASPAGGQAATTFDQLPQLQQISPLFSIASGALPTLTITSGTGRQISTARDVETVTPVTFNPGAATTATCKVELSPDNVTYSTLATETEPAGVAFDGTIHLIKVRVPAGWYVKLTVTNATLGTTTYY